ncbi:MAG: diguanylate cyclase, partial [Clostridia bacterium]
VLYGESDSAILKIAENIRQSVQSLQIRTANQEVCNVLTISLGVAHIQPQPAISPKALYLAADKALYFAKASGRNRVCTLPPSLTRR